MKRSIATVCLSGDLRQKIDAAARAGYDGIEIFENDLLLFDQSPRVVRNMVEDAGLKIVALQPFRDFEGMPVDKRLKNFTRAERKFDVMEQLGTDTLLICSNVSPHAIDGMQRSANDLAELAQQAAKRDFKIGYEALAWGRYIKDYQQAWELVKMADQSNLGIILDSFHIFARGLDLSTITDIPGNKITLVQIADAPRLDMDVLQWSRHFRCFPGQGDFPVVDFMQTVTKTGYEGYVSHEIFNDEFRSSPSQATALDGIRSLVWLEDEVSKLAPAIFHQTKAPSLPSPNIKQVEFIEFAAEGNTKAELLSLLSALGFVQTHHHRSKDVGLFQLGKVSFIINEEPDSFAQNHYVVHGTSVCAVAYLTTDAVAMAQRAERFHYTRFDTNSENGEIPVTAIIGKGEELVYFVQQQKNGKRFMDLDFYALETHTPSGEYQMEVDHITSGVAESEFLATSLFYHAFLGLHITQPQDLIDPFGVVVSRTATSLDKKIRLPFNMTRSRGASTERFRQTQGGSGVQHIALHCSNILKYVTTIDMQFILPIPENYYDDLEARFDLEPQLRQQLRQYNLLYDQNGTGHFIHFYTKAINGMFFEVVQRFKYDNDGEANAHVRMAAQARFRQQN
jgi:4-hydroxyphenylpyruvate dioxygenase